MAQKGDNLCENSSAGEITPSRGYRYSTTWGVIARTVLVGKFLMNVRPPTEPRTASYMARIELQSCIRLSDFFSIK